MTTQIQYHIDFDIIIQFHNQILYLTVNGITIELVSLKNISHEVCFNTLDNKRSFLPCNPGFT